MTPNEPEETPTFKADNIRAMSKLGQEIAALLQKAGYIQIVDAPQDVRA